jgi:hypothetical protein
VTPGRRLRLICVGRPARAVRRADLAGGGRFGASLHPRTRPVPRRGGRRAGTTDRTVTGPAPVIRPPARELVARVVEFAVLGPPGTGSPGTADFAAGARESPLRASAQDVRGEHRRAAPVGAQAPPHGVCATAPPGRGRRRGSTATTLGLAGPRRQGLRAVEPGSAGPAPRDDRMNGFGEWTGRRNPPAFAATRLPGRRALAPRAVFRIAGKRPGTTGPSAFDGRLPRGGGRYRTRVRRSFVPGFRGSRRVGSGVIPQKRLPRRYESPRAYLCRGHARSFPAGSGHPDEKESATSLPVYWQPVCLSRSGVRPDMATRRPE